MADNSAKKRDNSELAFQNVKVLTMHDEIWGLPAKIFTSGIALAIGMGVALYWWVAPLMALMYFIPMYEIHKDDPKAVTVWRRAMLRPYNYWTAGKTTPMDLVIISKEA